MQQHPVPQNIATYQFRLVGNMTIKQFLELLAGVILAVLFYYTNLFGLLKWTLMLISLLGGFALAFMPIEERPLDQWLLAYIRAIYSPTHLTWKKSVADPSFLSFTPHSTPDTPETQELMEAAIARKRAGLSTFLQTLPHHQALTNLEQFETKQLGYISQLFNPTGTPPALPTNPTTPPPKSTLNIDSLPPTQPQPADKPPEKPMQKPKRKSLATASVPTTTPVTVEKDPRPTPAPTTKTNPTQPSSDHQPLPTTTKVATKSTPDAELATQTKDLPFPSTPTTPNTVVGMVLNPQGKIIENVIIEIRDQQGIPVRATKTNRLGQFFSTTPLKNSTYELEAESPDQNFDIIKLELVGKPLEPIKIQAKS